MNRMLLLVILTGCSTFACAQNMASYFQNKGVADLSYCAHVSNPYLSGTYDIESDYVYVGITSYDSIFNRNIYTRLRIDKGFGGLYFSGIHVISDNDIVDPFTAFGLQSALLVYLVKQVSPKDYNDIKYKMIQYFNTNPENWSGKTWALFALNLDYYSYAIAR